MWIYCCIITAAFFACILHNQQLQFGNETVVTTSLKAKLLKCNLASPKSRTNTNIKQR